MINTNPKVFSRREGTKNQHRPLWELLVCCAFLTMAPYEASAGRFWDLPQLPAAHEYGDILIDRLSTRNKVKPVFFSHWKHRTKYTCRVCHWELDFAFKVGGTEITESNNRNGLYCGACHDGTLAFGHTEGNCQRCHTGSKVSDIEKFTELRDGLPKSKYGNKINWVAAIRTRRIKPAYSIFKPAEKPMDFRKKLELQADWLYVSPAYFRHDIHVQWLDCGTCHPDIFNIKKKATKHFSMKYILEGKFCGVCHLKVATPIDACSTCHPAIADQKMN